MSLDAPPTRPFVAVDPPVYSRKTDIWLTLWRGRRIILISALVVGAATGAILGLLRPHSIWASDPVTTPSIVTTTTVPAPIATPAVPQAVAPEQPTVRHRAPVPSPVAPPPLTTTVTTTTAPPPSAPLSSPSNPASSLVKGVGDIVRS